MEEFNIKGILNRVDEISEQNQNDVLREYSKLINVSINTNRSKYVKFSNKYIVNLVEYSFLVKHYKEFTNSEDSTNKIIIFLDIIKNFYWNENSIEFSVIHDIYENNKYHNEITLNNDINKVGIVALYSLTKAILKEPLLSYPVMSNFSCIFSIPPGASI